MQRFRRTALCRKIRPAAFSPGCPGRRARRPAPARRRSARRRRPRGPVSRSAAATAARAPSSSRSARIQRDRRHGARAHRGRHRLIGLDQLGERRDRQVGVVAIVRGAGLVHQDEHVGRRAVQQPERDSRVGGMEERALALHEEQVAALGRPRAPAARRRRPRSRRSRDRRRSPSRRSPRRSARWARTPSAARARAPPGRARASRPSCRSRCRSPRCAPRAPVRAAGRALRHGEVRRRGAQVAQLHARPLRGLAQLRVVGELGMQAGLEVEPGAHRLEQGGAPGRIELAARRRDADQQRCRRRARSPPRAWPRSARAGGRRAPPRWPCGRRRWSRSRPRRRGCRSGSLRARSCPVCFANRPSAKIASRSLMRAPPRGRVVHAGQHAPVLEARGR